MRAEERTEGVITPSLVAGAEECQGFVRMSGQNIDRVPGRGLDLGPAGHRRGEPAVRRDAYA
ncbi:hypothetical protein SCMC78_50110 [Streptomyces sp. CMC78]|uniref:Uncharacterized protein n=1 Tax=Streptomyces sp. CMC78 TaxID=3231512 RepID=A0AB33KI59_9ACTN